MIKEFPKKKFKKSDFVKRLIRSSHTKKVLQTPVNMLWKEFDDNNTSKLSVSSHSTNVSNSPVNMLLKNLNDKMTIELKKSSTSNKMLKEPNNKNNTNKTISPKSNKVIPVCKKTKKILKVEPEISKSQNTSKVKSEISKSQNTSKAKPDNKTIDNKKITKVTRFPNVKKVRPNNKTINKKRVPHLNREFKNSVNTLLKKHIDNKITRSLDANEVLTETKKITRTLDVNKVLPETKKITRSLDVNTLLKKHIDNKITRSLDANEVLTETKKITRTLDVNTLLKKHIDNKITRSLDANKVLPETKKITRSPHVNRVLETPVNMIWEEFDNDNKKIIELSVGLPAIRARKIIWLALKSLSLQTDITFGWELIIWEDLSDSKDIIDIFIGKLPGCQRVIHRLINPKIYGHKYGPLKGTFSLLDKWIGMSNEASPSSKIFALQACDCYSPPKRLMIHYENFKNQQCLLSTQATGMFYDLPSGNKIFYAPFLSKNNSRKREITHLSIAVLTKDLMNIPPSSIRRGIDTYILNFIAKIHNKKSLAGYIYYDFNVDKNSWKYGLDTDGANNISFKRKSFYNNPYKHSLNYFLPYNKKSIIGYDRVETYLPDSVIKFIMSYRRKR